MKIRLTFVLCALMLLLTLTGCEFPWTTESTEPTIFEFKESVFEFVDGKEVHTGRAQLSLMEISEILAALEPCGFSMDDCTDAEKAELESWGLMNYIVSFEDGLEFTAISYKPPHYGRLYNALIEYYKYW